MPATPRETWTQIISRFKEGRFPNRPLTKRRFINRRSLKSYRRFSTGIMSVATDGYILLIRFRSAGLGLKAPSPLSSIGGSFITSHRPVFECNRNPLFSGNPSVAIDERGSAYTQTQLLCAFK